ncbi:MAG: response regulator, partial [bacterium]|nr:response regulator [bacterium]
MNVLIADDDKLILETIRKYVDYRGDVSFLASDGSEALAVMKKESIDLVITDIQMPGISGFELMKTINEERPELPVIIITGYAEME